MPGSGCTDVALLSSLSGEAFGVFYDRWETPVLKYFAARTLCSEVSSDLAAETFCVVLMERTRFDPDRGDPAGFVFGIARNLWHRWLRSGDVDRRAMLRVGVSCPSDDELARVDELIDLVAVAPTVRAALDSLTPALAAAVTARVIDELTYPQAAARLGISEAAARARVSRAMRQLLEQSDLAEVVSITTPSSSRREFL